MPSAQQTDDPKAGAGVLAPNSPPPSVLVLLNEAGSQPMHRDGPNIAPSTQSSQDS